MGNLCITDFDFIPSYAHKGEDYDLVYGILQHLSKDDLVDKRVYNLICSLCLSQETLLLRKIKCLHWKELVNSIVVELKRYDNQTLVTIPFCNIYGFSISELLVIFKFAYNLIDELILTNFEEIEFIESIKDAKDIKSMDDLFDDLIQDVVEGAFEFEDIRYGVRILHKEASRRGLNVCNGWETQYMYEPNMEEDNLYYATFINEDSPHYIYKEVEGKANVIEVNVNMMKLIGTIYYMLKDALGTNKELIVKVASYITQSEIDFANLSTNTPYKYCNRPDRFFLDKNYKIQYIREQLEKYRCNIPDELK